LSCGASAVAASGDASTKPAPVMVDQDVVDAALEKLQERQREREASSPATQPATQPAAPEDDPSDPYSVGAVTLRKLEVLRTYDARVAGARSALRQRMIDASDVRRLCAERAAFQGLPLERCRTLMMEVDRQNAERLERYHEAFGNLPAAAKTVSVILMKSGQIDFATPLPEDPLTREVEESRGVRRVYFQFYLNPPNGTPRRHNGYVEFVFDVESALWVPTWCDYKGETMPLFDAEAFVPLRKYEIVYDGKSFVVAQAPPMHPPELFALLAPRLSAPTAMFERAPRW
jgi:hypothetical protein